MVQQRLTGTPRSMMSGRKRWRSLIVVLFLLLPVMNSGCSGQLKPFYTEEPSQGVESRVNRDLRNLPKPDEPVIVAVYRFRDQTGQYKASDRVASWSTAVTQGSTSILLKALEDSGWFVPIEREGLSNLMNERQIIQSIRAQHEQSMQLTPLPPLLYAGVILEGGIIGYDTNVLTGGAGIRYLGMGGSAEFRQDRVTVYLRATSTQSGRVLKSVHSSKTIVSQKMDGGLFRYVSTDRILEGEVGYTVNEPVVLAVTEAIEKVVQQLVIEGVRDGLWKIGEDETGPFEEYMASYRLQQEELEQFDPFGKRLLTRHRAGEFAFGFDLGAQRYEGNFPDPLYRFSGSVQLQYRISPRFALGLSVHRGGIAALNRFESIFSGTELKFVAPLYPDARLSPFLELGGGFLLEEESLELFPHLSGGAGIEYRMTPRIGFRVTLQNRYALRDGLDGLREGTVHDNIWSGNAGLMFYGW